MMNTHFNARTTGRRVSRLGMGGALAALSTLAACNADKLLDVQDVDVVSADALNGAAVLPSARAATIGDFAVAYAGSSGSEGQAQMSGLFTDELLNSESFPTRIVVDQRDLEPINGTLLGLFRDISRARATADAVAARYAEFDPKNRAYSEVLALGGYTRVILAENYCSGVPLSDLDAGGTIQGTPLTTVELLRQAITKFDAALPIAVAAGSTREANLARIGKARALLDLGEFQNAAAAVAGVPDNYRYEISSSENSGRQNNGIFAFSQLGRRFSIPSGEGINGLNFATANDPRVPTVRVGVGFDATTPLIVTTKYFGRTAPTPLAEGSEARLIEAEAALQAGNTAGFLVALNRARAAAKTYPSRVGESAQSSPDPIAALPATRNAQVDLLFRERAFTLFLTSHRLGDLRRLVRQYGRTQDQVFPTGAYFKGGVYGKDVNFPVSFEEANNPLFKGCIDRNA